MKKFVFTALLGGLCLGVHAQNEIDALRYSNINIEGTARFIGLGGAFGSLGADVSAVTVNPATMGRFSKSEISFTPQVASTTTKSTLYGSSASQSDLNFNISNFGLVGTHNFDPKKISGWKSVQFGFMYNRINNFNEKITIGAEQSRSLSFVFADRAEGTLPGQLSESRPYDSDLAYHTFLINPLTTDSTQYTSSMYTENNLTKTFKRSGRMGMTDLVMSGNYMNKIYLGGAIGIGSIQYREYADHRESAIPDTTDIANFTYSEYLRTSGLGYNFKLGIIFLPIDGIRIGASVQSPTFYTLTDNWNASLSTEFRNGDSYSRKSPDGSYIYSLRTPARYTLSASAVLFKRMLVSADYELINHANSLLRTNFESSDNYSFDTENKAITNSYRNASTIRLGAELRVTNSIQIRGGLQLRQNPVTKISTPPQQVYSVGLGYRNKEGFFFDAAFQLNRTTQDIYLYDPALIDATQLQQTRSKFVATVGYKWK